MNKIDTTAKFTETTGGDDNFLKEELLSLIIYLLSDIDEI
jgi:hypothetical protein